MTQTTRNYNQLLYRNQSVEPTPFLPASSQANFFTKHKRQSLQVRGS